MKIIPKLLFFVLMAHIVIFDKAIAQEKRIALVIGNAAYVNGSSLKNPVNDANLMAVTLQQLGFEVKKLTNASLKQMQDAAVDFTNKIGQFDVALFYYAGHGIQLEGINYLIPVDAKLDDKLRAKYEAFDISDINYAFAQNSGKMNIMILDACRDNPFRSWMRGGERGFQAIGNQATGTIIAFATREGSTAADGSGNNGLYTEKLVEQLKIAQNVNDVFKNTRVNVLKASNNVQCPQEWDMTVGSFYFAKSAATTKPTEVPLTSTDEVVEYYYGSIELKTELSGKLYIDGSFQKEIGAIESGTRKIITLSNIKTGSHTIEIKGNENWAQTLTIAKDQIITIIAKTQQKTNNSQQSTVLEHTETANVDINIPVTSNFKINTYALIIGNEDYSTFQTNLSKEANSDLSANDAKIFKDYCNKTLGIPERQIKLLINATSGQMNSGINWLNSLAKFENGNAELIFYYSGHGLSDETSKDAYLMPVDVNNVLNGIKLIDVIASFAAVPSKHASLFIDACFGGGYQLNKNPVKYNVQPQYMKGKVVMFSSSSYGESSGVYRDKQHGFFTYFLLKKLQETKGDVSYHELSKYLIEQVLKETTLMGSPQTPYVQYSEEVKNEWGEWKMKENEIIFK